VTPPPDAQDRPALVEAVIDALLSVSRLFAGLTARSLGELQVEVTLSQYRTLVVLASTGPQRTVDLAAELGVQPSTATRTCDRLVRRGLLRRFQRPDDRRVSWLGLSEEGRDLVAVTMRRRRAAIAALVDSVDIAHYAALSEALASLVASAGETPDPEWWERLAKSADDSADNTDKA
jgi:DNA-binding MarR family transcriptional regulator